MLSGSKQNQTTRVVKTISCIKRFNLIEVVRIEIIETKFLGFYSFAGKPVVKVLDISSRVQNHFSTTMIHSNLYNPAPMSQTMSFTFFVPDSALITNLTMTSDGENYVAKLKSAKNARDMFDAAVKNETSSVLLQVTSN
jgi:hypothetical protein